MVTTEKLNSMMTDNNEQKEKDFKPQAEVEVTENGPIIIRGNIILRDLKRDIMDSPKEVYLCRCGRSRNKPYCDGSHKK